MRWEKDDLTNICWQYVRVRYTVCTVYTVRMSNLATLLHRCCLIVYTVHCQNPYFRLHCNFTSDLAVICLGKQTFMHVYTLIVNYDFTKRIHPGKGILSFYGTVSRDFWHLCFCFKKYIWASHEQAKTVLRTFSFSRRYLIFNVQNSPVHIVNNTVSI